MNHICDEFNLENLGLISQQVANITPAETLQHYRNNNGIFFYQKRNDKIHFEIRMKKESFNDSIYQYLDIFKKYILDADGFNILGKICYFSKDYIEMKNYKDDNLGKIIYLDFVVYEVEQIKDLTKKYKEAKDDNRDTSEILSEIKKINVNTFIKELFNYYCKRLSSIDFSMLEAFRNEKNKMLEPIHAESVQLPYNLDRQFVYNVAHIFFSHVYSNSGLIFRLSYHRSSESFRVLDGERRLDGRSPKDEIEDDIKRFKLDIKWDDVFVKTESYR